MIIGIGSDILEVARFKRELEADGDNIKNELFTACEIEYCDGKRYPERHYAARFAAKEAFLKALATGKEAGISWRDVEIRNDRNGQPYIVLSGKAKGIADNMQANRILISLSHTQEWAMANVILES
jgi:holo-[acyl-carrier protein] synthase